MKIKPLYTFCVFALLLPFYLPAQTGIYKDSLVSSRIITLSEFWKKYNSLSTQTKNYENISIVQNIYKTNNDQDSVSSQLRTKLYDAKIKRLKNDVGLAATGNYQENFAPGFGADDDLIYNRRLQAGLDWNILANGYLQNRYKKQIVENERIINGLQPHTKISTNDYLTISHKIIYAFNEQKIKLLDKRQEIISDKIDIANELYLMKQLPKMEVIQIIQQQVDVSSMYQIYKAYNDQLQQQSPEQLLSDKILPAFDVDFEKIARYKDTKINDSILKLTTENIDLQNKSITDINLRTQVRYNYYDLVSNSNPSRSFMSLGLSLSVPLPLGYKSNKSIIEAEKELLLFEQTKNSSQKELDALNSIYEFRYKLKQYNNFYEKRKKYEELIRIERVKQKLDDIEFNPLTALNLLDEMLSIDIELLDIQQELYLQLLDILTKNPDADVLSIIKDHKVPETMIQPQAKQRSIYIWSSSLEKYENTYIEEYLKLNKISTAVISVKKEEKNKDRYNALFEKLRSDNISIEILIGSNKLLSSKNPTAYYDSIFSGLTISTVSAIHLDVEPHTFNDWQTNKEKYLNQYIELIQKTKQYADSKNIKLSVSIPVFYPEETLKAIYANCSSVYLMAYEHNDANFIINKVKEEFGISTDKTVIALRAKDFKTRKEFENLVDELSQSLNTTRFAMHDLETFAIIDEQSVGGNK